MAIALRGAGTEAHASSGNITPTLPGGGNAPQANDIIIVIVENGSNDVLSISGYTLKQGYNIDSSARLNVFYKRAAGGDSNPTVTGATQDVQANILVFSGCTTSGDPISQVSTKTNTASTTVTADAITPTDADSMIVFCGAQYDTGANTSTFSGYSGTNPTFTEGFDNNFQGSTINTSIFAAYGTKTDTTSTGSRTATATSSLVSGAILFSLIPASSGITSTMASTLAGVTAAFTGVVDNITSTLASTFAGVTASFTASTGFIATVASTLGGVTAAFTGTVSVIGTMASTLAGVTASFVETVAVNTARWVEQMWHRKPKFGALFHRVIHRRNRNN